MMNNTQILELIANGEDSKQQFKANMTNADALAAELVAFSNAKGGQLLIGVNDDGSLSGLNAQDIVRLNQLISNVASQHIKPPITPMTQNFSIDNNMILLVEVEDGINKPYMDNQGFFWTKVGADKRKITAREELQRLFQAAHLVHADELPISGTSIDDVDMPFFNDFFEKLYRPTPLEWEMERKQLFHNMNLMKNGELNLTGLLLFAKRPQFKRPAFIVKAVAFAGNSITENYYLDSRDISGKLSDMFQQAMNFVMANIHHRQNGQSVNSIGEPEIPHIVFEELIANALIHRDYFISGSIKLLIFQNRIEIISVGHLPNNLTVEHIKMGNSNLRNPILASFATRLLPYRGLGSGIRRALANYPDIEFIDDRERNCFTAIIYRN